jgi:hypothetical protein
MTPNLPISDNSHEQQRRSFKAFEDAIPDELFIIRNDEGDDYGNDKILELKLFGKHVSNFRAHVQIKSIHDGERTSDGFYSYPIPIITLNYLLNHPNSLFIVFLEKENILLWEWATDIAEYARKKSINIENTSQKTISYKFYKILDRSTANLIYRKILDMSQIIRQLSDFISTSQGSSLSTTINISNAKVISHKEISSLIKKNGFVLANNGYFKELNELIAQLPISSKNDSDLAVNVAYIKMNNGEFYDAYSWLPRGILLSELNNSHKEIAEYLEATLSYQLGILKEKQYDIRLKELESKYPESIVTLQQKLQNARKKIFEVDRTQKTEFINSLKELESIIDKLKGHESISPSINAHIKMIEWEIEGFNLIMDLSWRHFIISGREKIGHPLSESDRIEMAREYLERSKNWHTTFTDLYNNPLNEVFKASIFISYAEFQMHFISNFRALGDKKDDTKILCNIEEGLIYCINILEDNGCLLDILKGWMAYTNCLYGLGKKNEAVKIVNEVKLIAETYGNNRIIEAVNSFLAGGAIFDLEEHIAEVKNENHSLIDLPELELIKRARRTIELMNLPEDRMPNILIEYKWLQADEKEQLNYCKHLHVLQELRHSIVLENSYSINPRRKYVCLQFAYESPFPGTERENLIARFKADYCLGCPVREPGTKYKKK